jgi:hypothetical protein
MPLVSKHGACSGSDCCSPFLTTTPILKRKTTRRPHKRPPRVSFHGWQPEAVQEIDTVIIAYLTPKPIPLPAVAQCPTGCDLSAAVRCWSRWRRELRADLAAARGSLDAEVLAADLAAAERQIAALIDFGRAAA